MLVKYTGKASMLISEYDGKRYVFSKARPIIDIPIKVYDYIKASRGMYSGDIMPHIVEPAVDLNGCIEEKIPEIPDKPKIKKHIKKRKK